MLVVDGVELIAVHQLEQVQEFQGDHPGGLEEYPQAFHEVPQGFGTCASTLFPDEIGASAVIYELPGQVGGEELHPVGASGLGVTGYVGRGLGTERNDAVREVLEQVTVIARHLHHLGVGTQAQPFHHAVHVALGVIQPTGGV